MLEVFAPVVVVDALLLVVKVADVADVDHKLVVVAVKAREVDVPVVDSTDVDLELDDDVVAVPCTHCQSSH